MFDIAKHAALGNVDAIRADLALKGYLTRPYQGSHLHVASQHGRTEVLKVLLEAGASVDTVNVNGKTTLYVASEYGRTEAVKVLLEAGASVDTADKEGRTPLYAAYRSHHMEVMKVLLEAGAEVTRYGWTPLWLASLFGQVNEVSRLLAAGDPVDAATEDGVTPLDTAIRAGHMEVVKVLLEAGADVALSGWTPLSVASVLGEVDKVKSLLDLPYTSDFAPLFVASANGHTDVVKVLLGAGVPVDLASNTGWTPLLAASANGHTEAMAVLLAAGACVDVASSADRTPLFAASAGGHTEAMTVLLAAGASVDLAKCAGRTPLHAASVKGHTEAVKLLLKAGASVGLASDGGLTPLVAASTNARMEIMRVLLEAGAVVDEPYENGSTPLHLAVHYGHTEAVRVLLGAGAAVETVDTDGWTPLQFASRCGHTEAVGMLLGAGAAVNTGDSDGQTPLHSACKTWHTEAVRMLLEAGAVVDKADKNGFTPLLDACQYGHTEAVGMLLEAGAAVDVVNKRGETPLHGACQHGHIDVARMLLDAGAALDKVASSGTPLQYACRHRQTEAVGMLLEAGASVDSADKWGLTPLLNACRCGHTEAVRMLIAAGAAIAQDHWCGAPLHAACKFMHTEVVRVLIEAGAEVDFASKFCATPLHVARSREIVKMLLEAGATVDKVDACGRVPFFVASQEGRVETVAVLLEAGVSANLVNSASGGETALHAACAKGHTEVVKVLLGAGASVDVANDRGETPMVFASAGGHTGTMKVLLEAGASLHVVCKGGMTALSAAVKLGHAAACVLLCFSGASMGGVTGKGAKGKSPAKDALTAARQPHVLAVLRDPEEGPAVAPQLFAFLNHNKWEPPDAVVVSELKAIVLRFAANLRIKVILAGCKAQGKTSFLNALQGRKAAQPAGEDGRTQGMTIACLRDVKRRDDKGAALPPCRIRVFDFGGHEEYWSVQSSFLTGQCVVVVVVSLAEAAGDGDGSAHHLRLWLEAVFSRATSRVTVVMVGSHLDCVGDDAEGLLEDMVGVYRGLCVELGREHPVVVAGVSSLTREGLVRGEDGGYVRFGSGGLFGGQSGVEAVLERIVRAASSQLADVLGAPILSSWGRLVDMFEAGSVACERVFGGRWLVPWPSFCKCVGPLIGWEGDMSVVASLAEHLVHTGVAVACRSSAGLGEGVEEAAGRVAEETKKMQTECVGCGVRFGTSLVGRAVGKRRRHCCGCWNAFCDTCAPRHREFGSERLCVTCHGLRQVESAVVAPRRPPSRRPPLAGAGAAPPPAVPSAPPPRRTPTPTNPPPCALVIDMQRLVDAMKSVVSHSYAGVKYHDAKTAGILSGECAEEHPGDKETLAVRHRNMKGVAVAAVGGGVYPSLEAVYGEERVFVEEGRVRRRFLYHVLWHGERLVGGRPLFATLGEGDKDQLLELLCAYEHAVRTEEGVDGMDDVYLLPYLPSIKGVEVGVGGRFGLQRPVPGSSTCVGPVVRHRYDLQYFPADLFGQVVVAAYDCPVASVHQCWGSTVWLRAGGSVREDVMVRENVMVWHGRAGRYAAAAGTSSAVRSRLSFGGAGELHVMGWYDCPEAGSSAGAGVGRDVRGEVCRGGGGKWRTAFREVQLWVEDMCRRRIKEYGVLVQREVCEVDRHIAEVSVEAVEAHVAARGWLSVMSVEGVEGGVMPLHLAAPRDALEVPVGWRCGCGAVTVAGAGEAAVEARGGVEAWHPPAAMVNANTGWLQALHWEDVSLGEAVPDHAHVTLFDVAPGGVEFVAIESMLECGVAGCVPPPRVTRVQRVQNDALWMRYFGEWQRLRRPGVVPREHLLWHGTSELPPSEVYRGQDVGFGVWRAGMNDDKVTREWAGDEKGLYFADKAGYAVWKHGHATTDGGGRFVQQLVVARVITGQCFEYGEGGARRAKGGEEAFDSACGGPHADDGAPEWAASRMYMVSNAAQAYPAYVVSYTT